MVRVRGEGEGKVRVRRHGHAFEEGLLLGRRLLGGELPQSARVLERDLARLRLDVELVDAHDRSGGEAKQAQRPPVVHHTVRGTCGTPEAGTRTAYV